MPRTNVTPLRQPSPSAAIPDRDLLFGFATCDNGTISLTFGEQALKLHRLAGLMLTRAEAADTGGHPERIKPYLDEAYRAQRQFQKVIAGLAALRARGQLSTPDAKRLDSEPQLTTRATSSSMRVESTNTTSESSASWLTAMPKTL